MEHVGERALVRAPDAAADLVRLSEAEEIGPLDDQRVGLRDVEARFDDRRGDQAIRVSAQEPEHRRLELAHVHLPVRLGEAHARAERAQALGHVVERVDPVVEEEALPVAIDLAPDRLGDELLVVGAHVCANGPAALGRGFDHGDVAKPGKAHLEGARNRRRRERQHVDPELQLAQELLLLDAEALLLVDDEEPQVLGADVARKQAGASRSGCRPSPSANAFSVSRTSAGLRSRETASTSNGSSANRSRNVPRCCCASTVVGTSIITCLPSPAALAAARSATSVLP